MHNKVVHAVVRFLRPTDARAVAAIDAACFAAAWTPSQVITDVLDHPSRFGMVVEANGEVVGYCVGAIRREESYILSVAVLPAHQGEGHGTLLMSAMTSHLECAPAWWTVEDPPPIRLHVRRANRAAAFFFGCGFAIVDEVGAYAPMGGEPAYRMECR